ncbi:MAG TPA: tryptophan halogenase family protein [Magnetospirillaceae bacterium]|nr:tryptophan halogenase family protein [Magnetospirillaceae bacterium]
MSRPTRSVVVVGGGTAGWLVAGMLAARYPRTADSGLHITLIEAPDQPTIGVGEGTWPTIRRTLKTIGLRETELVRSCDASFKQGTKFRGWIAGEEGESYYHPFTLPAGFDQEDLSPGWSETNDPSGFAAAMSPQPMACEAGLAPKLITTPEYAGVLNYAYHLDAVKLGVLLRRHCCEALGVTYLSGRIEGFDTAENGDLTAARVIGGEAVAGDLFIDCSGLSGLILDRHYKVPFLSCKHILFADRAWAVQLPYEREDAPIASTTWSTAQSSGWIWDIGLTGRRGIGHVFSSAHISDDDALAELHAYVGAGARVNDLSFRKISFEPGRRAAFWVNNCVAVGMASGFIEPLEASAIVMIELAAKALAENFPATRGAMDSAARIYNRAFAYRWDRIIEFLKLHYVLSRRPSAFWQDNRGADSMPDGLAEALDYWRYHAPYLDDFPNREEIFGPAAYHYVLFGMGHAPDPMPWLFSQRRRALAEQKLKEVALYGEHLRHTLPLNRTLLSKIADYGLQTV